MFVCLSVGMCRVDGNPNPCTDLDEILHTHPHLSKKRFEPHSLICLGLKPHKMKGTFCLQTKDVQLVAN